MMFILVILIFTWFWFYLRYFCWRGFLFVCLFVCLFVHNQWNAYLKCIVPALLHLGFPLFFLLHTSVIPQTVLSPSSLLFVSHSPTTCHIVLPNSSISLLVLSSVCNIYVLQVQTFILGLQLQAYLPHAAILSVDVMLNIEILSLS